MKLTAAAAGAGALAAAGTATEEKLSLPEATISYEPEEINLRVEVADETEGL